MDGKRANDAKQKLRWAAYPLAAGICGALIWGGFFRTVAADVDSVISSAEVYARMGLLDQAEATCREALEREPDSVYGRLVLGMVAERRGEWETARKLYEPLAAEVGEELRVDLQLSCVDLLRREDKLEEARQALARLEAALGEQDARVPRMRGFLAQEEGRRDEMLGAFRDYAELAPESGEARCLLAAALVANERHEEARALLASMDRIERGAERIWLSLARSCLEAGDEEGAASALSRYAELDPRAYGLLKEDPFWSAQGAMIEPLAPTE